MSTISWRLSTALLIAASTAAAAPDITDITLSRVDDDLVIEWTPAGPADGYRVYQYPDRECAIENLIYDGAATSHTLAAALADPALGIYRVASYVAADEGDLSPPVYKFGVDLGWTPATVNVNLVSLPYVSGPRDGLEWCTDLNGAERNADEVLMVMELNGPTATWIVKSCLSPFAILDLGAKGNVMVPAGSPRTEVLWGRAPFGDWRFDFEARTPFPDGGMLDAQLVTLPYDHDYVDLAEVGADIPNAVEVRMLAYDYTECPLNDPLPGRPECFGFTGLSRPTSSDPWTGVNHDLLARPGEGLFVAVDVASSWVPRQHCRALKRGVGKVRNLRLGKTGGDDLGLTWDSLVAAEGGYDVYRLTDKRDLPDALASATYIDEPATEPAFPVADPAALAAPGLHLYQVVGFDGDDQPGQQ